MGFLVEGDVQGGPRVGLDGDGLAGSEGRREPARGPSFDSVRQKSADGKFDEVRRQVRDPHPKDAAVFAVRRQQSYGVRRPATPVFAGPRAAPTGDAVRIAELHKRLALEVPRVEDAVGVPRLQTEAPHVRLELVVSLDEGRRADEEPRFLQRVQLGEQFQGRLGVAPRKPRLESLTRLVLRLFFSFFQTCCGRRTRTTFCTTCSSSEELGGALGAILVEEEALHGEPRQHREGLREGAAVQGLVTAVELRGGLFDQRRPERPPRGF
mmetsp:Transcript_23719/g.76212  ORF Transcript_23719/g.76212 Transcript_23719/m.76212 type:complete len:267 (-) Transcript_23719:908-1708(-)